MANEIRPAKIPIGAEDPVGQLVPVLHLKHGSDVMGLDEIQLVKYTVGHHGREYRDDTADEDGKSGDHTGGYRHQQRRTRRSPVIRFLVGGNRRIFVYRRVRCLFEGIVEPADNGAPLAIAKDTHDQHRQIEELADEKKSTRNQPQKARLPFTEIEAV